LGFESIFGVASAKPPKYETGRWLFCGSWLALNALVFWAVMLRRGRQDPGVSLDLDD
jgi:hypothetical protein